MGNKFSKKENKLMARLLALFLCAVLLCGLGVTAFAADVEDSGEPKEEIVEEIVEAPVEEVVEEIAEEPVEEIVEGDSEEVEKTEEPKVWTVSFNVGLFASSALAAADIPQPVQVNDGECAALPNPAWTDKETKTRYTIEGWYTDEKLTEKFAPETPVTADITLFAKWNARKAVGAGSIDPDAPFITVSKTFVGIDKVPSGFYIEVTSGSGDTYKLYPDKNDPHYYNGEGLVWIWRIYNLTAGAYTVKEFNELGGIEDTYTVKTSGLGSVTVKAAELVFGDATIETTCSHANWPVHGGTFFAGSLTGKLGKGSVFITEFSLSESERMAFKENILPALQSQDSGVWKEPCYFFSIEQQSTAFEIAGQYITYRYEAGEVVFDATDMWQHVASVTFEKSSPTAADLTVTNEYAPKVTDVTVKKVVTGNLGDWNKEFSFSVLSDKPLGTRAEDAGYIIKNNAAEFSLKHNDSVTITGVEIGSVLQLEEVNEDYTITSVKVGDTTLEPKTGEAGNTYYEFAVSSETPISVEVTNWKDEQPETGISLDSLPYILILVGVGAAGVVMFLKKRRDAYDD